MFRLVLATLACGAVNLSCTDNAADVPLRSLQAAGAVSFLCVGPDGAGREMRECPDRTSPSISQNRIFGLVTQTLTGEVAVIDVTRGGVVDVNPSVPGFSFLPVGASPTDIVSTPDGRASFVGVAEPGREGIYSLPTTCIGAATDVSQFPACALPSRPSKLLIVTEPARPDGSIRRSCLSTEAQPATPVAASRQACSADVTQGTYPFAGRRKLLVLLPEQGAMAVLDAQAVLDRELGSYSPCEIEAWVPLKAERPAGGAEQTLPADLVSATQTSTVRRYELPGTGFVSRPSDAALVDTTLYVADRGAPVIHRLDVSDPCNPVEQSPLLPTSMRRPERVVTTAKIAVSPLTANLERFLYAIDDQDEPAASVMVFDVSAKATQVTPLVRPGAPRMPLEDADRISFTAPATDIVFANHDVPITDEDTSIGVWGTRCDPNPDLSQQSAAVKYRPSSNLRSGAGPTPLRGTFGFVLLSTGQVAVLDVDDADAACRRPFETEKSAVENFRGCKNDPADLPDYLTQNFAADGAFTVTNEVSCHVVERHRVRSAQTIVNRSDVGVRAPALNQFPVLSRFGTRLSNNQTEQGRQHPRLLPVDLAPGTDPNGCVGGACAQVFVNTTLLSSDRNAANLLDLNPNTAERNALTLPFNQPRSFPYSDNVSLAFEGALAARGTTGRLNQAPGSLRIMRDENALFCDQGVQSQALLTELGAEKFGLKGNALAAFAVRHADYVQLTSEVPSAVDPYWQSAAADSCSYNMCREYFGAANSQDLEPTRDFRVEQAYQDELSVVARGADAAGASAMATCCFPGLVSYVVRGGNQWVLTGSSSGQRHRVKAERSNDGKFVCALDHDPSKVFFEGRAFEISCDASAMSASGPGCAVGAAQPEDVVCRSAPGPVPADSPCVFNGLTARFAVYRGGEKSTRDMLFSWRTIGGFSPMLLNFGGLEASSGRVSPVALEHLPELGQLGIVDGSTLGLSFIDLVTPVGRSVSFY
ncbi:MAG: hypothetical protein SFV15_01725 [Polyangiaceae bacterium]|nr:hypothetical protein [Polyangiaceae bacterium]